MPVFIQVVAGNLDENKNTHRVNEVLAKLQANGAAIRKITPSLAANLGGSFVSYTIEYEAPAAISL
jgi:hypothetical protein